MRPLLLVDVAAALFWIRSSPTVLAESSASVMSPSSIDSKIWTPLVSVVPVAPRVHMPA